MATVLTPATETVRDDEELRVPSEQRFLLGGVDWETYLKISDALTERHVRVTYDGENLEIMTTSPPHSRYSRLIGCFVRVLTEELGLPLGGYGDMTCRREDLPRGIEPDECFYIENERKVRGRQRIDLTSDPPPDLGIEIDISRSSLNRLGIYETLCVPEVWRFDGASVVFYRLGPNGKYVVTEHSLHFPFLKVQDLLRFLLRQSELDDNALVREFRAWVREQISNSGGDGAESPEAT